jgi:hypothetical protein
VRAAAGRIRDDGIKLCEFERVELAAGKSLRRLDVPIVGVQRAATVLKAGRANLTPVGQENIHRIPIDVGESDVLHTTCEHRDAISDGTFRPLDRLDQLSREFGLGRRRHPLQFSQAIGKDLVQSESAQQFLGAECLIKPK